MRRGRRGFPCRLAGTTSRLHRVTLDSSVWEVGYRCFAPTHLENVVVTIHFWQKAAVRSKLAARVDLPTMMMLLKYIRQTQSGSSFKYDLTGGRSKYQQLSDQNVRKGSHKKVSSFVLG